MTCPDPPYEEFDEVRVTGPCLSENGHHFEALQCMVGTVCDDSPEVKLWPLDSYDQQLPPNCDGKLWFDTSDPRVSIVLTRKDPQ